jgi:uncharacterized protein YecE (DUF72 family)
MIRIGTSGWLYPPWRGVFFPSGLPQRRELEYLSRQVSSIEINGTFYSMKRPADFASWAAQTPDDFVFSVKAPRFITHMKKLNDPRTPLANFFASGLLALGPKLGPILWQLPPSLGFRPERLVTFFEQLPRTTTEAAALAAEHDERVEGRALLETDADRPVRHSLEVRHPSFVTPELAPLLREHGVALVVSDSGGRFPALEEVTADFVYARLHGPEELYASGYGDEGLDRWEPKVRRWATMGDVFVYFDNDVKAHAPRDARALAERLADLG